MIEYINTQLNHWAQWVRSGKVRLGYPREAAFMRPLRGGRPADINDDDAMDIERAVQGLRTLAPEQHRVVELFYLRMPSAGGDVIAGLLGCSRDTVYARLHRAHLSIMESLQDQEIQRKEGWRAQVEPGGWKVSKG